MALVTRDQVKANLQITGTSDDTFLDFLIAAADDCIKKTCGNLHFKIESVTEYCDGGGCLLSLSHHPVAEITSVTDTVEDVELDASDYVAYLDQGIIECMGGGEFAEGQQRFEIVYDAGFGDEDTDALNSLKIAAARLITLWYQRRADFISESDNGYSFSVGDTERVPGDIMFVLNRYKRRNVA